MRKINIVVGPKSFFELKIQDSMENADYFLDLVKLHDNYQNAKMAFPTDKKSSLLIVKNDSYLGITEQANDRIGPLIFDITTEDSIIYIHNPSSNLISFINNQKSLGHIEVNIEKYQYDICRNKKTYIEGIASIRNNIIGQDSAIIEISKTLKYLTSVKRQKPYVVMLYGNSSIGKTEMVREIAKSFFDNKFYEQHLSMYKSGVNQEYIFGDKPNRRSIGFDLLERESNLVFLDEIDKCLDFFHSVFYTLFDNTVFKDAVYDVDVSGILIVLTSNYLTEDEIKEKLGLPIYYRIDKFIHFQDFDKETIYAITKKEISGRKKEYEKYFTEQEIYNVVSKRILINGENARTIKNKIQAVIEELVFEKYLKDENVDE